MNAQSVWGGPHDSWAQAAINSVGTAPWAMDPWINQQLSLLDQALNDP